MGLNLVKKLISSYGGKIWLEDRVPGVHSMGTTFIMMLPVIEQ